MGSPLHNELRKEFQLERLILFSDAVFAIAITLLVIEIRIPDENELEALGLKGISDNNLLQALGHLIPKFVGFLVSFLIIGQYWIVHHRMFGFVTSFTDSLIWLNILFLLAIVLMPFSTGFYSEYVTKKVYAPVVFYTANITMLGTISFFMWRYISSSKRKISENLSAPLVKYFLIRALAVPVIFIIFCFVYLIEPQIAVWIPIAIPVIMRLIFYSMKKQISTASKQS